MTPRDVNGWAAPYGGRWHRIRNGWPLCSTFGPVHVAHPTPEGERCQRCQRAQEARDRLAASWRKLRASRSAQALQEPQERPDAPSASLLDAYAAAGLVLPQEGAPLAVQLTTRRRGCSDAWTEPLPAPRAHEALVVLLVTHEDARRLGLDVPQLADAP